MSTETIHSRASLKQRACGLWNPSKGRWYSVLIGTRRHTEFSLSIDCSPEARWSDSQYTERLGSHIVPIETTSPTRRGGLVKHKAQLIKSSPEPALESTPVQAF
jgi:hypothetical protein